MKVLILSAWEDTGGIGYGLMSALNKYTDWEARFVHRHHNYIGYPTDIYWEPGAPKPAGLDELFEQADVIHVMERWSAIEPFERWLHKPLVMHHHGTEFRVDNTEPLIRTTAEYRAVAIASTIDLTLIDPSIEWLPSPCDIKRLYGMKHWQHEYEFPTIAHSPTNRMLKATDLFLAATKYTPYKVDLIEGVDWETCLHRKADSDVFFDQLFIGYALSGMEAMAMYIPVIGGAQDRRILDLMQSTWGYIPFLVANESNLASRVELMLDYDLQKSFSSLGYAHVHRYHDEQKVARQLVAIYERAMALR